MDLKLLDAECRVLIESNFNKYKQPNIRCALNWKIGDYVNDTRIHLVMHNVWLRQLMFGEKGR